MDLYLGNLQPGKPQHAHSGPHSPPCREPKTSKTIKIPTIQGSQLCTQPTAQETPKINEIGKMGEEQVLDFFWGECFFSLVTFALYLQQFGTRTCHFAWYLLHFGMVTFHFAWYLLHFAMFAFHFARYLPLFGTSTSVCMIFATCWYFKRSMRVSLRI